MGMAPPPPADSGLIGFFLSAGRGQPRAHTGGPWANDTQLPRDRGRGSGRATPQGWTEDSGTEESGEESPPNTCSTQRGTWQRPLTPGTRALSQSHRWGASVGYTPDQHIPGPGKQRGHQTRDSQLRGAADSQNGIRGVGQAPCHPHSSQG